ncbi:MAG: hypothetical protein AAF331_16020 [Pseudomonadota bacterium]
MSMRSGSRRELTPEERRIKDLETFTQDLKVLEIKRRSIQSYTKRLPWMIAGAIAAGIPLAISVLALSVLFIFIFGSIFSGVMAQIIGPSGAFERRRKAREIVATRLQKLATEIDSVRSSFDPILIAYASASKSAITFSKVGLVLTKSVIDQADEDGAWDFGRYKFAGVVLRQPDGSLSASHPGLKGQYWMNLARSKGHAEDALNAALNEQIQVAETAN